MKFMSIKFRRPATIAATGLVVAALFLAASLVLTTRVQAQDARKETLVVANESGPNGLDIHAVGANRPSYGVAWVAYDRLMTYGKKTLGNGTVTYDFTKLEPELAERWDIAKDGSGVTFYLRKNAKFHDGTPVTASDVKWSFDRALAMGGFPLFQMKAGSLESPDQFTVVNDHTFKVKFIRPDKMTMPDMAVPVASIYNSALAKKNATAQDPWASVWLKSNTAGGGAYKVASFKPGQEIVYERYDEWKSGPLPKIKRVIQRDIPSAGNRRALLVKGDIDMTYELPPKDFNELAAEKGNVKVVATPVENAIWYLGMNVNRPPFDNVKVRQAVAMALPYDKMWDNAVYQRGVKLYGASNVPKLPIWPQAHGYSFDITKAKALLAEGGFPNGFETTLSFDLGGATVNEPMAILIQESLAQIGIKTTINKIPGANWRGALLKKDMPLIINRFGGWLNYPEYFFFWCYHGQDAVFNTMSYKDAMMDKMIENARFPESKAIYDDQVKSFVKKAFDDVPRVPLFQPSMDVAMQKNISGYMYWFHLQPDFRQIVKN
jgi:peptide/nickel transport system substrate-binding protein